MLRYISSLSLALLLITSCTEQKKDFPGKEIAKNPLLPGNWRMVIDLGDAELPVNFNVMQGASLRLDFLNADEKITAYEYTQEGDSLFIRMPLFDSEFCGTVSDGGKAYTGLWRNYARGDDYALAFTAQHGRDYRFCETLGSSSIQGLSDKYEVTFSPGDSTDQYKAIGLFSVEARNNTITGTFMTETGDYRYLEGNLCEGNFALSCFDGSHAFLFTADWDGTELSNGIFRSGNHWAEPWDAVANPDFELRDPNHLTVVKDSTKVWNTRLITSAGEERNLADLELEGKVVIVQALGSWCPNCIDESNDFVKLYDRYHDRGLEIIPIAFENTADIATANSTIEELREDLKLPYPVYYGGEKSKTAASEAFPALNHIMSFPTSMIIGRDGRVKKVHTGFYGPGTGRYYEQWKHDMEMLLDELLGEEV